MSRRQRRWQSAVFASLAFATAGLAVGRATLLLAGAVPLVYVAAGSLSTVSGPEGIRVTRAIEPTPAPPGQPVAVTVTVENDTGQPLSDVRVIDGVPEGLAVTGGTPRAGETLDPGESVDVRYAIVSRRGEYEFDRPTVTLRGLGAGAVADLEPVVDGDERFSGKLDADAPPLSNQGDGRVGQLTTDDPGEGVTFHSTREYTPGDAASRIDWRHYAKRGSLTTVNYDQRVTATIVIVLDARRPTRVVSGPGRPTGVELAAYAATRAIVDLLETGHDVALAVVGLDGPNVAGLHWLPARSGSEQRARATERLRKACEAPPGGYPSRQFDRLLDLVPANAQIALVSPLLDDAPVSAVEHWRAANLPTTILSPDVIPANTVSGQLAQVQRRTRLARCQRAGARPIDWRRGTPLALVIEEAFAVDARLSADRLAGGGR